MDRFASIRRFPPGSEKTPAPSSEAGPSANEFTLVRFWKDSYWKALPWLILIMIGTVYAKEQRWLERFEMFGLDVLVQSQAQKVPTDIFVIEITNADYREIFKSKSPLDPVRVLHLIEAILPAHPSVIGVDIDTEDNQWGSANVRAEFRNLRERQEKTRLVWAEVPAEIQPLDETKEPELQYQKTLGGEFKPPDELGVVRFPVDQDGVVRRYKPQYELPCSSRDSNTNGQEDQPAPCPNQMPTKDPGKIIIQSFPRAVAPSGGARSEPGSEEHYLNFSGVRYQLQVVQASEFLDQNGNAKAATGNEWNRLVGGKIVLIGGSYGAARDEYQTSFGRMWGVELLANVTESVINPKDAKQLIAKVPLPMELAVDFLLGTALVGVYFWQRYHPWRALFIAVPGLVVVPFLLSLAAFHWLGLQWLSFIPITLGMLVHQLLESAGQAGELHEQKEKAEAEVRSLRQDREVLTQRILRGVYQEGELSGENVQAELEVARLIGDNEKLSARLRDSTERAQKLNERYERAQAELKQLRGDIERLRDKEEEVAKLEREIGRLKERVKVAGAGGHH